MKWLILLLLLPLGGRAQIIVTFAGCGSCSVIGDGGPATAAAVLDPNGGMFDKYGNYYFAEPTGERVRKINTTGVITTVAGGGSGGLGDGGAATAATLNAPTTVLVDSSGNLYIDDADNYRIRKVDASTGIIYTICGNGISGFSGDGSSATTSEISVSEDICFDKFGNLYIADQVNTRVRKINTMGIISTFAGTGGFSAAGTGDGGPATAATFNFINSLAADDTGNIYIGDINTGRVRKVDTFGIITTIAGNGTYTYIGDDIAATDAQISPARLGFDSAENLYIADKYNHRVYKVDLAGILHNIAGNGIMGYSGDGAPATSAEFNYPYGVAFDACGNLYVPDVNNKRIRKVILDSIGIPSIAISPSPNDTVCTGTSVTFSTYVSSGATISYQWYVNGALTGTTGNSYSYTPANSDSISCVLTGVSQCSGDTVMVSSNTIDMVVNVAAIPTINLAATTTALVGSTVTVNATVTNAGSSYSINWYDNGMLFSITTVPVVTYIKDTGTDNITATVVPVGGCYDSTASSVFSIGATTGISNIAALPLNIYPNPVHEVVYVDGDVAAYRICDVVGAVLQQGSLQPGNNSIPLHALAPGVYLLEVTNAAGVKTVKKLVKQ